MKSKTTSIRKLTLLAVPFTTLLVYVMATARPVNATSPGTNGKITFTQGVLDFNGGAPANVFTANPDGSNVQQVPLPQGIRVEIFSGSIWSPDGNRLLISHTLRLDNSGQCCFFQPATVKPDGSSFNQLVPPNRRAHRQMVSIAGCGRLTRPESYAPSHQALSPAALAVPMAVTQYD
jgi:hypothetical protein